MSNEQEFQFINGAATRLLLVVEPKSSEFWIKSRASVRVLVSGGRAPASIGIEYMPGGVVVYTSEESNVQVLQNGHLLSNAGTSRRMVKKLMQQKDAG